MDKQDLNGVRTAQDIEQKYNLGAIDGIIKTLKDNEQVLASLGLDLSSLNTALEETQSDLAETNEDLAEAKQDIIQTQSDLATTNTTLATTNEDLAQAKSDISSTNTTLNNFVIATNSTIQDLQNEIDGSITTFFHAGAPTMNNYPVNTWQQSDYSKHVGDLYYDTETGYAYRFYFENNVYGWGIIRDTGVAEALAIANSALDTADDKRRVFLEEPEPPYDSGDLWVNAGELYICQISRESGSYQTDDFITSLNYTDDTYAMAVEEGLTNSIEVVSGRVLRVEESTNEFKITTEETLNSIQNETNQVRETLNRMEYSFGTDDLQIAKLNDPTNMRLNNSGLKIYNLATLISIFNKNGAGVDKLILIRSFQFQNLLLKKRSITWNNPFTSTNETIDVVSGFWLKDLIEDLEDLEG